ncbi:MAG: RNA polymerase subunit sigma-70 [Coprothermobacterota bacterium]|nr:RNA polymerase subunit sigma-70 [Coprothermobacterota bacterium]
MLEERIHLGSLFRQYAPLLTDRQRCVLGRYLEGDLSLAEIGDSLSISRQGAYDLVRRASRTLEHWEERLSFCRHLEEVGRRLSPVLADPALLLSAEDRTFVEEFLGV